MYMYVYMHTCIYVYTNIYTYISFIIDTCDTYIYMFRVSYVYIRYAYTHSRPNKVTYVCICVNMPCMYTNGKTQKPSRSLSFVYVHTSPITRERENAFYSKRTQILQ